MFYDFKITGQIASNSHEQSADSHVDSTISNSQATGAAGCMLHHTSGAEDGIISHQQTPIARKADDTSSQAALYLAPRELDVLKWAAQGKTTWETAQLLDLSEATVAFYARRACARLGVKSKIHAVAVCISVGLFKI
ncbi:helix-turn-helix transcriptional regulator [Sulfitobacter sp. F26169L]|uniref:helix-turn-helix domain-containing protein n=1 Tax=Sulfitobacter sp. F26169L TaxID=2996015 RepID=UPI002260D5C0|nr:helix-turn-helix transcriptional regulator [Sulfitobacter sp. F26169L]MCX7567154.1 helix-turn-helix transcriptional regulator [Sulfitobacter sp. F26169L]